MAKIDIMNFQKHPNHGRSQLIIELSNGLGWLINKRVNFVLALRIV